MQNNLKNEEYQFINELEKNAVMTDIRFNLTGGISIMKKICMLFSMLALASAFNPLHAANPAVSENCISVEASASMAMKPDEMNINFIVRSEDTDIMAAKKKNSDILKKVMDVVKKYGVTEKDIQMDNESIELKRIRVDEEQSQRQLVNSNKGIFSKEKSESKGKVTGYAVINPFSITVKTTENIEAIIVACFSVGVSDLNRIDFSVCDQKKYRDELRVKALVEAKLKAEKMAAVLGCRIGSVLYISDKEDNDIDCSPAKSKVTMEETVKVKFELK